MLVQTCYEAASDPKDKDMLLQYWINTVLKVPMEKLVDSVQYTRLRKNGKPPGLAKRRAAKAKDMKDKEPAAKRQTPASGASKLRAEESGSLFLPV